tara:strand:+ start:109 stop:618 length:510 start_codon:yes stop_codon:yes gene_type:complete
MFFCVKMSLKRFSSEREKKRKEEKKEKEKSLITFNLGYQKKKRENSSFVSPKRGVKASKEDAETTTHTHTHTRHMFAATTTNTTSLFSSTRRHHQKPSSSRRPAHPFFVCASSSLKSTRKQQEKDDRKTVDDDVDRRDVLTKAALVASVAMTTMTPKPVRARSFCKRRR